MSFGLRNVNEPKKALRRVLPRHQAGRTPRDLRVLAPAVALVQRALPLLQRNVMPPLVAKTLELERRRLRLPQRVDPRLARPAHARRVDPRGRMGPTSRTATSRSGIVALHRAPKPLATKSAAPRTSDAPDPGRGARQTPVGWTGDSRQRRARGVAGQAGPQRPHLRGAPVRASSWPPSTPASSEVDRRPARRVARSPTRSPTSPAATCYEAGGKRVRPMLALLTAQLGDGATDDVIDGATALEITHLGSLYHDDVMDDADKRRGVPSAHAGLGQLRRDPHRRPAVRPRQPAHGAPRRPGDPPAGRHLRATRASGSCTRPSARSRRRGPASRTTCRCSPTRPARSSRPPRSRASSSRTGREEYRAAARSSSARRSASPSSSRRRDRPLGRPRRDRQGARHRPARRRADDAATSCSRQRTDAASADLRAPHRRRRRAHRRRAPTLRSSTPRVAELREHAAHPGAPSTSPTRGRREAVDGARAPARWRGPRRRSRASPRPIVERDRS